jgi:CPA1 family monovalent cation:H+ antiporter
MCRGRRFHLYDGGRWQDVALWGGLRGALALALALNLTTAFPYREQILNLRFGVVIFSILVQGLTIKPFVRIRKLANGDDAKAA